MLKNPEETLYVVQAVDVLLEKIGLSRRLLKEGGVYTGACPFCGHDGFTFHVSLETYNCQSCRNNGNILRFVVRHPSINVNNTLDAWNWLAEVMFEEMEKGRNVNMEGWLLDG